MSSPVAVPKCEEPLKLTAGDEVNFVKKLSRFLATNGWLISYTAIGGGSLIQWPCTVAVDTTSYDVIIPAALTLNYIPGDYQLQGFVSNAATGERYQFYANNFRVFPNLQTAQANLDLTTHAQRMLVQVEAQLELVAQNILLETDVEGTKILREKRNDLLMMRNKYLQERKGEIAAENARNHRPTGRRIKTVLVITLPGNVAGSQFGAGNSVYNTQWP